jgi:hypothetical protein
MMNKIILSVYMSLLSVGLALLGCASGEQANTSTRTEQGGILTTSLGVLTLSDVPMEQEDTLRLFNDDGSLWHQFSHWFSLVHCRN